MLQNLLQQNKQKKKKQKTNSCFNLPHKHFDYVALFQLHHDDIDDEMMLLFENDSMPLVLDCCDGVGTEEFISSNLVVLNHPYTLELQIQNLETGAATTPIQGGNANDNDNDDMWGMDLEAYFPDQNIQNFRDEEFDLIPLGIDCKATTSNSIHNKEEARMIVVGKSLRSMERVCHEFVGTIMTMNTTTTTSNHPELEQQQQKYICRSASRGNSITSMWMRSIDE